jgi:hypothetical protein
MVDRYQDQLSRPLIMDNHMINDSRPNPKLLLNRHVANPGNLHQPTIDDVHPSQRGALPAAPLFVRQNRIS